MPFRSAWICLLGPNEGDVAWSHNSMPTPVVNSVVILMIVSCKWARAQSMGANEPFGTLTLSKELSSSMAINTPMSTMPTSSTGSWLQSSLLNTPSSNCKYVRSTNKHFKPPWWIPWYVPQYSMILFVIGLVQINIITTWCLQNLPYNAHSQMQLGYLVKGAHIL